MIYDSDFSEILKPFALVCIKLFSSATSTSTCVLFNKKLQLHCAFPWFINMRYFMTLAMKSEHFFCSLLTVGQIQDLKKKYEQVFQLTHRFRNLHVLAYFLKVGNYFLEIVS